MANYLAPGVFMEEVAGGSRPVEGVATSVAAFVGFAEQGPLNEPVRITNWNQFTKTFGEFTDGSYLGYSVYGYFANGGGTCYVVRVGTQAADEAGADGESAVESGTRTEADAAGAAPAVHVLGGFQVAALPAAAGRDISVDIQRKPSGQDAGVGTGPEADTGADTVPETDSDTGADTGTGVKATRVDGDKPKAGKAAKAADGATTDSADVYTLTVNVDGSPAETFEVSSVKTSPQYVVRQVRKRSKLVAFEEGGAPGDALELPEQSSVALTPPAVDAPAAADAADTTDAADASDTTEDAVGHYIGEVSSRSGLSGLEAIDDVTMLVAPDLMGAYERGTLDREQVKAIQLAMIDHCENMANRMAILDPLPDMAPAEVHEWRQNEAGFDSKFAALYYPWVRVADPSTGKGFMMPPSGHVAGLWARNDEARGVHKAPANEVLRGVLDLGIQVTKGEQDQLNPAGVNCIRSFPGRGIRVWGARTLSSDPAWRYLNVRRLFNYLEESVYLGSQWVVFEPNDERLWSTIRRNVTAFLTNEWRRGALFGSTSAEAFYVKCDEETNPPEVIESGQVVCEIGVAPVKPAEFVVFRISQESLAGAAAGE